MRFMNTIPVLLLLCGPLAMAQDAAKTAPAATPPAAKASAPAASAEGSSNDRLNVWLKNVSVKSRAATTLWPAWTKASAMPGDGAVPMPADIWSGMTDVQAWSDWAAKNPDLAKALNASREASVLGVPYGEQGVDAALKAKGLVALPGSAVGESAFPYLRAVRGLAAYAILEMQRLGAAKNFDGAFQVGVDGLRMLRQTAEQRMSTEKVVALELLASSLEAHRVFLADHLDQIPEATLQKFSLKEYPMLKRGENERMKRLEIPEGDRVVVESVLVQAFGADGQPNAAAFAERFGRNQAESAPITRFGAAAQWRAIAEVHGSLDASKERLESVYDDWWRRWRMRFYDPMNEQPSEFSNLNAVRYASVSLLLGDMQRVFALRMRVIAEIDGTCVSMGLCGFRMENGKQWPRDINQVFPQFALRRMNMDPYSKKYGAFEYRDVGSKPQAIDTAWGQVTATGALLWSLGGDHEDGNTAKHDPPDGVGDIVMWPPPRQLAQKAGLIK